MVILDKYHDDDDDDSNTDAPPSYETISAGQPNNYPVDEKSSAPRPGSSTSNSTPSTSTSRPVSTQSNPSSWLSMLSFSSSRTTKQVRQTVLTLIRDLVLNADAPHILLDSCANACRTYRLDLTALLQEPCIEHHSAIYWGVLNRREALLPLLLIQAAPLSQATLSEIRLACLATANQALFQSLRCRRESMDKAVTPLSTSPGRCSWTARYAWDLTMQQAQMHSCWVPCPQTRSRYVRWKVKGRLQPRCGLMFGRNGCGCLVVSMSSLSHEVRMPSLSSYARAPHSCFPRPDMVSHVFLPAVDHAYGGRDVASRAVFARAQSAHVCRLSTGHRLATALVECVNRQRASSERLDLPLASTKRPEQSCSTLAASIFAHAATQVQIEIKGTGDHRSASQEHLSTRVPRFKHVPCRT